MANPKRPPVFREDGTVEIHLTRGYVAIVDPCDAGHAKHNWRAQVTKSGHVYAVRWVEGRVVLLHREILGLGGGHFPEVDHRDGDGLNCRRENIRAVTPSENRRNREAVGVYFQKARGKWLAHIDGRHLGSFDDHATALAARLAAERESWGVQPRRAHLHQA